MTTPSTNQGWHTKWFYLRQDPAHPLPAYQGRIFEDPLQEWKWGVGSPHQNQVDMMLAAIAHLCRYDLDATVVVGSYHRRRFAPLMWRTRLMHQVTPGERVVPDTVMSLELLPDQAVARRVKVALGSSARPWPVQGAPKMKPDAQAIDVVSGSNLLVSVSASVSPC